MPATLKVEDYMATELIAAHPEMETYEAIQLLLKHEISGMPVVDDAGKLVGVLSERDCLETLADSRYHELPTALVKDLMTKDVVTVGPNTSILEVSNLFVDHRFRRFPVIDGDKLVGQISRRDVLRAIQELHL